MYNIKLGVLAELMKNNGLTKKELMKKLRLDKKSARTLDDALRIMKRSGEVKCNKKGIWRAVDIGLCFKAEVLSVNIKSGFIEEIIEDEPNAEKSEAQTLNTDETDEDAFDKSEKAYSRKVPEKYFVRGMDLRGAIPGDIVMARKIADAAEGRSAEAVVLFVVEKSERLLTGTVVAMKNKLMVYPDELCDAPLLIVKQGDKPLSAGEKVAFSIKKRGKNHYEHMVEVVESFGSANGARSSAEAYMLVNGLHTEFPDEVIFEAQKIDIDSIEPNEAAKRLDLREEPIFTIDGADTKDIDDAVSVSRTEKGFNLGVHIADVSHYVEKGSAIDDEAFLRGTSIYYADKVVPMLPKELSNGICSLNPNVDRLAFSCLMEISASGELLKYKFEKSVVRSRVKGVYSEVNRILDGEADDEIKKKYAQVIDRIPIMRELAQILMKNRISRGAPEIETPETKIITDENGKCIDVRSRGRGIAEQIIEEFMLMANKAAASLAMKEKIPFVYRIHEAPAAEKLVALGETLTALGVDPKGIGEKSAAADLAEIIRKSRDTDKYTVINRIVLRTMMKAKYSDEPLGHFGLVMPEYAHFTSPIRRYADLSIHRILSDYFYGMTADKLVKKYSKAAFEAALQASRTELSAVKCERECEGFYMAEYIKNHVGEEFDGFISGVTPNGIFAELPNTVEGMISVKDLPAGDYEVMHNVILVGAADGTVFTVGDKLRVKCVSANTNSGFIDFEIVELYNRKNTDSESRSSEKSQKADVKKSAESDVSKKPSSILDGLF